MYTTKLKRKKKIFNRKILPLARFPISENGAGPPISRNEKQNNQNL